MAEMTENQRVRTIEALAETNRMMEREMRYSPDLRKQDRLAFYTRHIVKLTGYLATGTLPDVFERS